MAEIAAKFSKTKIIATLGPATGNAATIRQLIRAGIDAVRLNMSHGSGDFFEVVFDALHKACTEENTPLAILVDLQGPKIRVGEITEPGIFLQTGELIEITTNNLLGTKEMISTSYQPLVQDAAIGDRILINDGLIQLTIIEKKGEGVICRIDAGGLVTSKKGMNLPGMNLSTPSLTDKDFRDLEFALQHRVDYIALSFVRSAADVTQLKDWLSDRGEDIPVIAKIEKREAVENLDAIIAAADGIMIARGDLGVELPPQDVPVLQKIIIQKCNAAGKLVITATQMLESMIHSPVPTRAEASDVANAVWDGSDAVMLSGETSVGAFPVDVVRIMRDIVLNAEMHAEDRRNITYLSPSDLQEKLFDSIGHSIVEMSGQIDAQAIVVFTFAGRTARIISKYRPYARIIAISNSFETMNRLCLRWGVNSVFRDQFDKEHLAIEEAKELLLNRGLIKKGDLVIFAAGAPSSEKSRTSWTRFEVM
ncbi:MAG: pyruvate kinase [Syntrophales bacterium]|jgi:pyruvate kinase|nr:pyruvate kinase [Syntrophales bacterium]